MKDTFKNKYRIKSNRLQEWDYSQAGYYYVTICTHNHVNHFGNIRNEKLQLSQIGNIAQNYWSEIPQHFPHVTLDEYIIMPNHIHGIIIIGNNGRANAGVKTPNTNADINANTIVETQNFVSLHNVDAKRNVNTEYDIYIKSAETNESRPANTFGPQSKNLGSIIRGFKAGVKKWATMNDIVFQWQSGYYDHIIRNERSLHKIREYITTNPAKWEEDEYYTP